MLSVEKTSPLTTVDIYKILSSKKLSDKEKADFIKNNKHLIKATLKKEITRQEYDAIMEQRPLIKFRPLKNSFTKRGDEIILAKSLNIDKKDIQKEINAVIESGFRNRTQKDLDRVEKMSTFVFRHGTKDQLIAFLEYELSDVQTTLKKLYHLLDLNSGGLARYFSRPIHRMNNRTIGRLYKTIDKCLKKSAGQGFIKENELNIASKWALVQIYKIQNNQKIIHAYNLYKDLKR